MSRRESQPVLRLISQPASRQEHDYAELGWKVLATLVASELATKADSDVIQVIAEHAALGEQATDEGGRAMAQKATPEPKGWADVRKAAAQAAVKASEKTGRPVVERVKKLAES